MSSLHDAWAQQEHATHFDALSRLPSFILRQSYERFNEVQMLNHALLKRPGPCRLLEIGCATGEFYRYLRLRHPHVTYIGCDISRPALERARQKYPAEGRFIETDVDLKSVKDLEPDIIFCRDVAHHQADPMAFICQLYDMAKNLLVMRVRTRDEGETVRDPGQSCQLHGGHWVPYIVVNAGEFLNVVGHFSPKPGQIHLTKHYMVLGGHHLRYLPKDCYFKETRTAETALLVNKAVGAGTTEVIEEARVENLRLGSASRTLAWMLQR